MEHTSLTDLSPTELLATLDTAWVAGNRALARMLAYLGEVERRGLHVDMSCSSMFVFVERRFGLTGGSAFRRLTAARLVRRFPTVMSRVESGDIHLEALCALRDVLTAENVDDLMAQTAKKTLREVEAIVACLAPRPDVKGKIRKLPERRLPDPTQAPVVVPLQQDEPRGEPAPEPDGSLFAVARAVASQSPVVASIPEAIVPEASPQVTLAAVADRVVAPPVAAHAPTAAIAPRAEAPRPRMQQLSEARHKVQLTVSSETRAKIERAQALMRHRNPSGDLEVVFDRAMDALLEKLEKERLGKTSRPQKKARPSKDGHIPAETRREVFARDGEQCTHVDQHGNRCGCRDFLELDHVVPRAKGSSDEASNLSVACRAHNRRYADQQFGKDYVLERIEQRREATRSPRTTRPSNPDAGRALLPDRK